MADQIPLIGPRGGLRPRTPRRRAVAAGLRVRVLLDSPVPQLDRLFDFTVPARLAEQADVGVRVRVRLGGQRFDGYIAALGGDPDYSGPARPVEAVVSPVPVLPGQVLELCRQVARHYCGGTSDVVRLAVPPRVARAEREWQAQSRSERPAPLPGPAPVWQRHLTGVVPGAGDRAVWTCPPGVDWAADLARAAASVAAAGRGVLMVLPDGRDVDRVAAALAATATPAVAVLRAEDGPDRRYRAFLAALAGRARIVVGTRGAAFAPMPDLGLAIIWDDGDPTHSDPHAPYPHAREVLVLRSHMAGSALLIASHSRTCEAQRLVARGWARDITDRTRLRSARPRVTSAEDRIHSPFDLVRRFPAAATAALRSGLAHGPVLVAVARTGYVTAAACQSCREPARCPRCGGLWEMNADSVPRCRRCGDEGPFECPRCGGTTLRAVRTGAGRTAEEAARLFPDQPVTVLTGQSGPAQVPAGGVVVATPGMEPAVPGGYAAAYLPDAEDDLWRPDVRGAESALRRWCNAAALVRPGAPVVINADPGAEAVQALIRWDPAGFAARELQVREQEQLPPAVRLVRIDAASADAEDVVAAVRDRLADVRVLGPRTVATGTVRMLLTSPDGVGLVEQVRRAVVARAGGQPIRVQVDPVDLD